MNPIGLRRKGFDEQTIQTIKRAFRLLLQSKLNTRQAMEAISKDLPQIQEIQYLIEFIRGSKRGIIK